MGTAKADHIITSDFIFIDHADSTPFFLVVDQRLNGQEAVPLTKVIVNSIIIIRVYNLVDSSIPK